MNSSKLHKGYWALAAISFFWGTTWFVSKIALKHLPPLQMTGMRQTTAGIIMISYFLWRNKKFPPAKDLLYFFLVGFLLISCSNGLTTWAVKYIPSYLGALISCLMPFVMILSNFILFREKVKRAAMAGLVVGFSGIAILLSSFIEEMGGNHFLFGVVLTLIGVGTWTTGTLMTTRSKRDINPFEGIGWQMLFGGLILLLASRLPGHHVPLSTVPLSTWLWLIYLTAVGSIFCFICYLYALKTLPISMVTIYVYINPIVALLMGVLFLNEKISLSIALGALITFLGIYLVKRFSK